jgi:hypothetical protein
LARNLIVKSVLTLSQLERWSCEDGHNDQKERPKGAFNVSALRNHAALAGHDDEDAGNGTATLVASRQPKRCDTLIASALLVLLIAGWVMNFVSVRQLSLGLGSLIAHTGARHT